MFDHVLLNVPSRKTSMSFYTPALKVLGVNVLYDKDEYGGYGIDSLRFWIRESDLASVTRKAHLAFAADSRQAVDEFYAAALLAGGRSNGAPGLRDHGPRYYAAYVLDLEENNIEAVFNT
jgi:catechol 2,3-dioxygenase-like lactoylglutathione lyase family enzyme